MTERRKESKRTAGSLKRASRTAAELARDAVYVGYVPEYARFLPEGAAESLERLGFAAGILRPWMCSLFE